MMSLFRNRHNSSNTHPGTNPDCYPCRYRYANIYTFGYQYSYIYFDNNKHTYPNLYAYSYLFVYTYFDTYKYKNTYANSH